MYKYLGAPNSPDLFTRMNHGAFDEGQYRELPAGFIGIYRTLGTTVFQPDSLLASLDQMRMVQKSAKLKPRGGAGGVDLSTSRRLRPNYSNIQREFPLMEETASISASELLQRVPGESTENASKTKQDRLYYLAVQRIRYCMRALIVGQERLAFQGVNEGQVDAIFGTSDANYVYDFYRNSSNEITVSNAWTDTVNGTPIDDLDALAAQINTLGYSGNLVAFMRGTTYSAFINHPTVTAQADNLRFKRISIDSQEQPPVNLRFLESLGFEFRGYVELYDAADKVWIVTYNKFYTNDSNVTTYIVPTDEVTMMSMNGRFEVHYGPDDFVPLTPEQEQWMRGVLGVNPSNILASVRMGDRPLEDAARDSLIDPRQFSVRMGPRGLSEGYEISVQTAPLYCPLSADGTGRLLSVV